MGDDRGPFLRWQWSLYPGTHRDRRNLLTHALTAPVFQAGTLAVLLSPLVSLWLAPAGLLAMVGVMGVQRKTHRLEGGAPAAFRGPGDVVKRFLAEQWITFPRYVASGEFGRAWRESGRSG